MNQLPKPVFSSSAEIKAYRLKKGMNQSEFWGRIGVTQSGGSRYESDRNIPGPVMALLTLAYGTDGQANKLIGVLRAWKK